MANDEYGYFWNSNEHDRVYDADSFSNWLRKFFTTGVFQNDLQVTANGGMTVKVGSGYANVEGKVRIFDGEQNFTITAASGTYPRIDTVVVEKNENSRSITAKVVQGAYNGANPSATPPTRTSGIYQIVLAEIYVNAGATAITQANITDKRGDTNVCGWVVGTVDSLDIDQILEQAEAEFDEWQAAERTAFNTWFAGIQDTLDGDTAGHLQNEIDAAVERITTAEGDITQLDTETDTIASNVADLTTHTNVQIITTANTNLNDYQTTGIYFFASQYTPRNIPAGTDGWLLVFANTGGYVKQLWFRTGSADTNDHEMYSRLYAAFRNPPVWSAWSKYVATKDVPALVTGTLKTVDRTITLHSGVQASASGMYYKQTTVTGVSTIYAVSIVAWQNLPAGAAVTPYYYVSGSTRYIGVMCSTNTFPSTSAQVTLRLLGA